MDYLPEIIAQTAFVPSGVFMGYMLYIFEFFPPESLVQIHFWPWMVGITSAAFVSILLIQLKHWKKREIFCQFYIIGIGTCSFLISGILFLQQYGTIAIFIAAIGHGMNYVSILSYINVRISPYKRSFHIAFCHTWYFLGCALASQMINISSIRQSVNSSIDVFYQPFGIIFTATSSVSLFLLILNGILNYFKIYNYRRSLDSDINDVNEEQNLFLNKMETIDILKTIPVPGYKLRIIESDKKFSPVWLLLLKFKGFIMFSSVMIYFAGIASIMKSESKSFDIIQWLVFGGSVVGLIAFRFYNTKNIFHLFSACQSLGLVVSLMIYNRDEESLMDTAFTLWLYYAFLGGGYCIADIAILDVTPLRTVEYALAIGYLIEIFPVALLQYVLFYQTEAIILHDNLTTFRAHGFVYISIILVLMVVVALFMPNTYKKSLLEIQNELYGITYEECQDNNTQRRQRRYRKNTQYAAYGLYTINEHDNPGTSGFEFESSYGVPS